MSPTTLIRETAAWFLAVYLKSCACPPLDLRREGDRWECGRCGKMIQAKE